MTRLFSIAVVLAMPLVAVAQAPAEKEVSVPESLLTDAQKSALHARQVVDRMEQYGNWVGLGEEIGKAVHGALSAVTGNAEKFAETGVGKLTVALVVWKVIGSDVVGLLIGVPLLVVFVALWWRAYRRAVLGGLVVKSRDGGWLLGKRTYERAEPTINDAVGVADLCSDRTATSIALWLFLAGGVLMLVAFVIVP